MRVILAAAGAGMLGGCSLVATCPTTVSGALGGAPGIEVSSFVAVGRVARFVDSPDAGARGYDLDVWRGLVGSPSPEGTFLLLEEEVPGISQGDPVLILAERGPNDRTFRPGLCQPLIKISEEELLGVE